MSFQVGALFIFAVLASATGGASGQSLGEVARQEEARRKAVTGSSKTYTNKDLPDTPPPAAVPPSDSEKDAPEIQEKSGTRGTEPADAKADQASGGKKDPKDEAFWTGRLRELRSRLDRDEILAAALQSRLNALTTDAIARDDPAQRGALERERQRTITELDTLKQSIQEDKTAIADFQEEGRRLGVPAGWMR